MEAKYSVNVTHSNPKHNSRHEFQTLKYALGLYQNVADHWVGRINSYGPHSVTIELFDLRTYKVLATVNQNIPEFKEDDEVQLKSPDSVN